MIKSQEKKPSAPSIPTDPVISQTDYENLQKQVQQYKIKITKLEGEIKSINFVKHIDDEEREKALRFVQAEKQTKEKLEEENMKLFSQQAELNKSIRDLITKQKQLESQTQEIEKKNVDLATLFLSDLSRFRPIVNRTTFSSIDLNEIMAVFEGYLKNSSDSEIAKKNQQKF
eukprot:TRINITY_DN10111_c0_g1_i4.p1 TRINITY_DN10111_c0_g1~~TRINITY_DN10111_c0_g1_i4.p1  ORF type:complete len:172 (-),score=35.98 TRINITY_DN10111_c0_g1_i4:73-588(-)